MHIGRRHFIIALAAGGFAPLVLAQKQVARIYRLGFLSSTISPAESKNFAALRGRLRELGYDEGRNITLVILKGAKAGDIPVEQPMVFDMVVNLRTAKSLGVTVAPTILARADRVIQ